MIQELLSRENLLSALKRVEANKGSHGVDGMSVKYLREHILQNWQQLRQAIEDGTYEPSPVRRVEIPKPHGFSFTWNKDPKIRLAPQSMKKVKAKIRDITSRKKPLSMEQRIKDLNRYLTGWCGYFALADTPSIFNVLDKWIRRRLRMCLWKQWKKPKTKVKRLLSLGVPKDKAFEWGNTLKGYWRIACSPILHRSLDNQYWKSTGLKNLTDRYNYLRNIS